MDITQNAAISIENMAARRKILFLYLLTTMFIAAVGELVKGTKKGLTDTAGNYVKEQSVIKRDLVITRLCHCGYVLQQTTSR